MKRMKLVVTAIALAAVLAPTWSRAEEIEGAKVYSDQCARCHLGRAPWEYSDEAWAIIVHHMHAMAYLTRAETDAVRKFLQETNFRPAVIPPPSAPPAEAPPDGKALVGKFACVGCHVIQGTGGTIGPNLDTLFERRDTAYILRKLSEPTFDNPTSVMPFFAFSEEQTKAIADYLRSLNP
jgi:mono/diheme cytochrome c family protein